MSGQQIIPLAVKASFTGSTSTTHNVTEECEAISIINRGTSNVTFTINGISVIVAPGETFNGTYRDFNSIDVVAVDDYAIVVYGR